MTLVSHAIRAAELAESGIGPALEAKAVITMNARILGAIRYRAAGDHSLKQILSSKHVALEPTTNPDVYLAALLVNPVELAAIEAHLLAIRDEDVNLGYTTARVRRGFNRYAVDAAVASAQIAKKDLEEAQA